MAEMFVVMACIYFVFVLWYFLGSVADIARNIRWRRWRRFCARKRSCGR